jgi:tetraacyldisaccharide 4'-kinase
VIPGKHHLMLARDHPDACVLVDPCRKRAGQWAWQAIRPDLYILDDGFQHLAVQRDINLLLIRPEDLNRNWNRVIPSGPWREGANALNRASALIFHADPELGQAMAQTVQDRMPELSVPMFSCSYRTRGVRKIYDRSPVEPDATYILVSAVGNPTGVEFSARQVFFHPPQDHMQFPDHHSYTIQDWSIISQRAKECKAQYIVCTPKDRVKLEAVADSRLCVLDVCLDIAGGIGQDHEFGQWLQNRIQRSEARRMTE